jgi:4'-phosphopantetheinyl transferase
VSPPLVLLAGAFELPRDEEWLGPAERAALVRLRVPKRRRDFRLGRFAAKTLLEAGEPTGDLARFEVRPAPSGAPLAFHDGAPLAVALSISHSNGWACAATQSGTEPLGCDLERIEPRSPAFLEDYFTQAEQAFVATGPQEERSWRATLIWSAKEAVMKALGQGLRLPPAAVRVAPASTPVSVEGWGSFSVLAPPAAMTLRGSWRVLGEFVLTVAGGGDEPRLLWPSEGAQPRPDPDHARTGGVPRP